MGYGLGVALHPRADVSGSIGVLADWAAVHGTDLMARPADAARYPDRLRAVDDLAAQVDAVVSLGGDGTMLGAMRSLVDRPVPVLGVNHGNLGFLVEVHPAHLHLALERLLAGDFEVQEYPCLRVSSGTVDEVAFNDVTLARRAGPTAVATALDIGGHHYGNYRCDALIVATPIGSTAYNYAAGGPILSPAAAAMVVTPVAPMSGISRPLVLAADEHVTFRLEAPADGIVVETDGIAAASVAAGDRVEVREQRAAGLVVRLDAQRHSRVSNLKLSLLDLPLGPDQLLELVPAEIRDTLTALRRNPPAPPKPLR